jgi:hypothetical protein
MITSVADGQFDLFAGRALLRTAGQAAEETNWNWF